MLYVTTLLRPGSTWGLGARLYLRSLAMASAACDLPFRLLWTAACSTDQLRSGMVQSFGDVLDPSTFPPSLQPLRPHFGPGSCPQPATCMLFVGEVADAVERISRPDECPAKNVVLTSWPASAIPPHLAVRLSAYDLVLVPEGEGQLFRDADVPYVVEVPWPAPTAEERTARVQQLPQGAKRLLCAAGGWSGEDGVGRVADAFLAAFKRTDGVGLVLACGDIPQAWVKNAVVRYGKENLPFIHAIDPYALWDDPAAVDRALLASHAFVDASRRIGPSSWRQRAVTLGCPVTNAFAASVEPYAGEGLWSGVTPSQAWRSLLPLGVMTKVLRADASGSKAPAASDPAAAGATIAKLVRRVVAGESLAAIAGVSGPSSSCRSQGAPPPWNDGIGVVVPFGGADVTGLRRCLESLLAARRGQDRIIVSVRGEHVVVVKLCEELGVPCVLSTSGGDRWNMSAARNAGVRGLEALVSSAHLGHVAFVDADVVVPPGYLQRLAREAYKRPGLVLTPYVIDEGRDVSTARIASGMSVFPLKALIDARGFAEGYVGWGEEDLDLLHRLREMHNTPAVLLPNMPPATHTPHAAREGDEQKALDQAANMKRYAAVAKRLDAGEQVVVNVVEWGTFDILHAPLAGTLS